MIIQIGGFVSLSISANLSRFQQSVLGPSLNGHKGRKMQIANTERINQTFFKETTIFPGTPMSIQPAEL